MANPSVNLDVSGLSLPGHMLGLVDKGWQERLPMVTAEVKSRITRAPAANLFHQRARLWNRWIFRNALDEVVKETVA